MHKYKAVMLATIMQQQANYEKGLVEEIRLWELLTSK
jgi:hypothetical protein